MSRDGSRATSNNVGWHKPRGISGGRMGAYSYIVGFLATSALVCALSAQPAQAASPFDGLTIVQSLELVSANGSHTRTDMQLSYKSEIETCSPNGYTSLINAMNSEHGGWFINQWSYSANQRVLTFTWSSDPRNSTVMWEEGYDYNTLRVTNWGNVQFSSLQMILEDNDTISCHYNVTSKQNAIWYESDTSPYYWSKPFVVYNVPFTYPPGYEGEIIPDNVGRDPLYQDPWNLPPVETENCEWWNFTCFMGTVDFNPIREIANQASENLGFVRQLGGIFGDITTMVTAMPDFWGGIDPCWSTGMSGWCEIPVEIFDGHGKISLFEIRNSAVMQAVQPWLLYAMIGMMSWGLFRMLPKIIESITKA